MEKVTMEQEDQKRDYTHGRTHDLGEECVDNSPSGVPWDAEVVPGGAKVLHNGLLHLHVRFVDHGPEVSNLSSNYFLSMALSPSRCFCEHF